MMNMGDGSLVTYQLKKNLVLGEGFPLAGIAYVIDRTENTEISDIPICGQQ